LGLQLARPDFLDGTTPALHASDAASDDQRLTERMRVPGGPGARLEGDAGAGGARRIGRLEQRIDAHGAGEPVGRPFGGGLGAASSDVHGDLLFRLPAPSSGTYVVHSRASGESFLRNGDRVNVRDWPMLLKK
jgi:hypothetical protein